MSCDALKRLWSAPALSLSTEAAGFLQEKWNKGDPYPPFFQLFGELHHSKFKGGAATGLLKEKYHRIWTDCVTCLLAARQAVQENRPLTDKERGLLSRTILPLCAAPRQYASVLGLLKVACAPPSHQWFERLYAILDTQAPFPENLEEQRAFELCLTRTLAATRISETGQMVDYNWVDLIRKYCNEGDKPREAATALLERLRLREGYDVFFNVFSLQREIEPKKNPPLPKTFREFVNEVRVEELRRFTLKIPLADYPEFEDVLLHSADEQDRLSLFYFYRVVEQRLGPHFETQKLPPLVKELTDTLHLLYDEDSAIKQWLLAALFYTLSLEQLKRQRYPKLNQSTLRILFFLCRKVALEEKGELFSKLFSLPECRINFQGEYAASEFLDLLRRNWLTPSHLLWVFFHLLEVEISVKPPSDTLNFEQLTACVVKIQAFLGYPLPSDKVRALFGGSFLDYGIQNMITRLPYWRKEIHDERHDLLPHYYAAEFKRRRKELGDFLTDATPFNPLKQQIADLLWFSTYVPPLYGIALKAIPLEQDLRTARERQLFPQGVWLYATSRFGEGPHIRCQWRIAHTTGEYCFEILYAPALNYQKTVLKSFKMDPKIFNEVFTPSVFLHLVENYIPQEFILPREDLRLVAENQKSFLKEIKIVFHQLPHACINHQPELAKLPAEEVIQSAMTFPISGGVSLLPPEHSLAAKREYSILWDDVRDVITALTGAIEQRPSCSTKFYIDDHAVPVHITVGEHSTLYVLSGTAEFCGEKFQDQIAFPQTCEQQLMEQLILGLLIQFKGRIYRERRPGSNARHLRSQRESLEP